MNTILYGYQLTPGDDDEFIFSETIGECQAGAIAHRAEILRDDPENHPELSTMAVYRFEFRAPTSADFIAVLNETESLLRQCVVDRR